MSDMLVYTGAFQFRKARSVNATGSSFPSTRMVIDEPKGDAATATGRSIIELCPKEGGMAANGMMVMPYSTGADNDTYSVRVYGWRFVQGNITTAKGCWRPVLLIEMACTATATDVGIAGGYIVATEMFADTLSLATGNDDVSVDIVSPTGDVAAHFVCDLKGCQKAELTFKTGTQAPTDMNALVALL